MPRFSQDWEKGFLVRSLGNTVRLPQSFPLPPKKHLLSEQTHSTIQWATLLSPSLRTSPPTKLLFRGTTFIINWIKTFIGSFFINGHGNPGLSKQPKLALKTQTSLSLLHTVLPGLPITTNISFFHCGRWAVVPALPCWPWLVSSRPDPYAWPHWPVWNHPNWSKSSKSTRQRTELQEALSVFKFFTFHKCGCRQWDGSAVRCLLEGCLCLIPGPQEGENPWLPHVCRAMWKSTHKCRQNK